MALDEANAKTIASRATAKAAEAAEVAHLVQIASDADVTEVCCDGDGGVLKRLLRPVLTTAGNSVRVGAAY